MSLQQPQLGVGVKKEKLNNTTRTLSGHPHPLRHHKGRVEFVIGPELVPRRMDNELEPPCMT
jgi:hypothetical protein